MNLEQRERLIAALNRLPTNPPSPRMSVAELDELRALFEAGREADAWAEFCAKGNAAMGRMVERVRKGAAEARRETERQQADQREHAARMAFISAQATKLQDSDGDLVVSTKRKKSGRPKVAHKRAQMVHRIIEHLASEEQMEPHSLRGNARDLLDACRRIESATTKKTTVFSTTEGNFTTWLKAAGYAFPTGRPVKSEARYWTTRCVKTMGNFPSDVFA